MGWIVSTTGSFPLYTAAGTNKQKSEIVAAFSEGEPVTTAIVAAAFLPCSMTKLICPIVYCGSCDPEVRVSLIQYPS